MRDYLEELLDLLTQEAEEEAAGVWETQTASLILPKALEAEAPEGALELPEGMAAKGVSSGDGGDRPWLEREPALEPALDLEEIETVPGLDGALDQEAAIWDFREVLEETFASTGGVRGLDRRSTFPRPEEAIGSLLLKPTFLPEGFLYI